MIRVLVSISNLEAQQSCAESSSVGARLAIYTGAQQWLYHDAIQCTTFHATLIM
jgi:hypothetical protein